MGTSFSLLSSTGSRPADCDDDDDEVDEFTEVVGVYVELLAAIVSG